MWSLNEAMGLKENYYIGFFSFFLVMDSVLQERLTLGFSLFLLQKTGGGEKMLGKISVRFTPSRP